MLFVLKRIKYIISIFASFCKFLKDKKQLKDLNEVRDSHLADYFLYLDKIGLAYSKLVSISTALRIPIIIINDSDILLSQTLKLVLKGSKQVNLIQGLNRFAGALP